MDLIKYTVNYFELDCNLEEDDIKSANGWLSDNVVQFFGELIEKNHNKIVRESKLLFIQPPASNFLRENPSSVLNLIEISEYEYIFCPINDSNVYNRSGSHWSLLVISLTSRMSLYLDSMLKPHDFQNLQVRCAKENNKAICDHFKLNNEFRVIPSVQQTDGSSCGVYTIFNMMTIGNFLLDKDRTWMDFGVNSKMLNNPPEYLRYLLKLELRKYCDVRQKNKK